MVCSEIIAGKIAFLCEKNDMTVAELAGVCKMNRTTLEHIMSGKCRKPRIQTLYKIADAFHMSVQEFLELAPDGGQQPESYASTGKI